MKLILIVLAVEAIGLLFAWALVRGGSIKTSD